MSDAVEHAEALLSRGVVPDLLHVFRYCDFGYNRPDPRADRGALGSIVPPAKPCLRYVLSPRCFSRLLLVRLSVSAACLSRRDLRVSTTKMQRGMARVHAISPMRGSKRKYDLREWHNDHTTMAWWNSGESLDPLSEGRAEYREPIAKRARCDARTRTVFVRSHHKAYRF